jgi:hypothetical protein
VRAVDASGNMGEASSFSLTVDSAVPTVTAVAVTTTLHAMTAPAAAAVGGRFLPLAVLRQHRHHSHPRLNRRLEVVLGPLSGSSWGGGDGDG